MKHWSVYMQNWKKNVFPTSANIWDKTAWLAFFDRAAIKPHEKFIYEPFFKIILTLFGLSKTNLRNGLPFVVTEALEIIFYTADSKIDTYCRNILLSIFCPSNLFPSVAMHVIAFSSQLYQMLLHNALYFHH